MRNKEVHFMHIDKKILRYMFIFLIGAVALYWIVLDTERAGAFVRNIWGMFTPFILGSAIAFIFNVPMRAVERQLNWIHKPGLRRGAAVILTLVLFAMVIAFVVLLLVPQIRMTVESVVATLPEFISRESQNVMRFLEQHPEVRDWLVEYTQMDNLNWTAIMEKGVKLAGEYLSKIFDGAFSAIGKVTNGFVNAFLGICFAFYALARKEVLARQCRRLLYSFVPEHWGDEIIRIMRLTNSTFSNFISGQCLEACILGVMFAVVMTIMGLPYMPLVSVIIAVTALVPLVGAFVGCILGALFILVESPVQAFTFVIVFLVLQQIEGNLIYPKVVGTSIGLPGMWVLVALTVGGELAGVAGMLLMIPLSSVLYALLREFTNARVAERNIPAEKLRDHPPELKSKFKEKRERKREQQLLRRMKELAEKHAPDKGKKK
jgi:predicted PurR-regulated permease PerM